MIKNTGKNTKILHNIKLKNKSVNKQIKKYVKVFNYHPNNRPTTPPKNTIKMPKHPANRIKTAEIRHFCDFSGQNRAHLLIFDHKSPPTIHQ